MKGVLPNLKNDDAKHNRTIQDGNDDDDGEEEVEKK